MFDERLKTVSFGEFRFDQTERTLTRNGENVGLPPKAIDILALLIERQGQVVSREDLLSTVWKDTFVEEGNINYTISLLRKALGDKDLIQTVPRRGYKFVAPSSQDETPREFAASMGSKKFKRLAAGALLLAVLGVASSVHFRDTSSIVSPSSKSIATLAVLPLENLSEDDADNALILGLTDSLITRLAGLRRFSVRPYSAVEQFAKAKKDVQEIGTELKCDAIITGTFQKTEGRMRVALRLLNVRDGSQLWTQTFDEPGGDIFALQDQLALRVAGSLLESVTSYDEEILGKRHTENRQAYLAYLRGRTIFSRRIANGFQQSLDAYHQALALDPAFALAYSGLGDLFTRQANGASGAQAVENYKKATSFIKRALELDADLSEAHAALGQLKRNSEWDWNGAERSYKKAIELDPNNARAIAWYAQMLAFLGRSDEALEMVDRAIEIDPVTPMVEDVKFSILESAGRFEEGLKLAEQRHNYDKQNQTARRALPTFLFHTGQYERALAVTEEMAATD
ncbi:MAG: winged helix-turn-helix domain-containing tetratricopeptide repeat protein, partial [Pyrinomonadaceae bacterium]